MKNKQTNIERATASPIHYSHTYQSGHGPKHGEENVIHDGRHSMNKFV